MPTQILAATLTVTLVALVVACGGRSEPPAAQPPVELSAPALDGGEIDLSRYRGQVVVIHLFAPHDPVLVGDVEQLSAADREAGDEIVVLGVALESGGYPIVAAWRRAMEVDYLLALVTEASELQSAHLAPLQALPTTLVIDRRGRLTHRVERPLRRGELGELLAPLRANVSAERHPHQPR